jgi:hypothetical protein
LQGQLSKENYTSFNPFGTYDGITIDRPKVIALSTLDKIEDIDDAYIRAQGHFKHEPFQAEGQFQAEGKTFRIFDNLEEEGDFEIVGRVIHCQNDEGNILAVSSYKPIPTK